MIIDRGRYERAAVAAMLIVASAGCGEDRPTAPTPVTPPNSLTITAPATMVLVGSTVRVSASGIFSDGLARPLTPRWAVDNPTVASIDAEGQLRALGNGAVTIVGVFEGVSASIELRVIPDYRGPWAGPLRQTSCIHWDFRGCSRTFPSNATFTLRLNLQQTATSVQGDFELDSAPPPNSMASASRVLASLAGTIADDGTLTLEGPVIRSGAATSTIIYRWRSHILPDGTMTGGFTYLVPSLEFLLHPQVVEYDLAGLRRGP